MFSPLYRKSELSNGLKIVTEEIPHVRSVALGVWTTVGSRDEDEQNNGIAHFIEHMLFKGTRKRNTLQIAESLEIVGGSLDAFTTKESTCYAAHILDEHLPLAVEVLSDIIINSTFDHVEIEKEKDVILKEIANYRDTPDDMIFEYFYKNVFDSHPLAFEIYGTEKNIKGFRRTQLMDFMSDQYTANRMVISAAGNMEHDVLVSHVERHFNQLPEHKHRRLLPVPTIRNARTVFPATCTQAHVCFGMRAYAYADRNKFPLLIIHTYLGGGMSSVIFQNIREEHGLAYTIYGFYDFFIDSGLMAFYFSTDQENIDRVLDLIRDELQRLKRSPMDENTLTNMKNQLKGNLMLGLESTTARMNRLARNEIYLNQYYTLDQVLQEIDRVSVEDIVRVTDDLFREENYYTTILNPNNS